MIYPALDRTTVVAGGERWLAWTRNATGERVIGIEDGDKMYSIELRFVDAMRAKFPDRIDDIERAIGAFA